MKIFIVYATAFLLSSMQLVAQHPLVGTWEMVSMKGTDKDGKKFSVNTSMMRETKIITPTHYMLINHQVKGDSVIFDRCHAGTARVEGNKYIETPLLASWDSLSNDVKTDFAWNVMGDKFIQSGVISYPDGTKATLEALVFQKVKAAPASIKNNPMVGTWDQLSSSFTLPDGTKGSHTNATHTRFYVITPTHWMMIGHGDKKFQNSMGGPYQVKGHKFIPSVSFASFPVTEKFDYNVTHRFEGDKLFISGIRTGADGKKMMWDDVFQKVN
jgi:hypothetical protein